MNVSHFDKQAQRESTCSLVHGTWRCVGAKIACAGACALMVGQLLLPSVALATECADPAAGTDEVAAAPVTPTVAEDTAATTAPAASTAPATDAAPAAQATVEPQQTIPADAANEPSGAALAGQNASGDDNAAMPASNAIMPCGVTDVTGGGGVRVNTTVVDHYTNCELSDNITLEKGQSYTHDFPDVEGGIPEALASEVVEVKYYRADAASGTLVEVQDASMSDVTARFEPVGNHMRLTLTFTGGAAGGSYRLTRNEALYIGSALEYTGTDYEGSSTILNETRYDYYLRYAINSEITLVASENEALHNLNVNDVKTNYAPGEAPRATATIPAADADKYEIAYECWEEMDGSDPAELTPVAFWYSDPAKYPTGARRIEHFEEGKFYMYSVELRLKGDNTVGNDCMMYVNGHWTHHIKTVNGVFAPNADNMLCEQPIDEWRAIDVIEINGATTTFKAGDKPVFTANVPTGSNFLPQCEYWTGSDGSEVNSQEFWDQNITNHIDAFKPGVTYRYGIYLKSARGFYFTPNTKLVINGQECGYQVADSVSDEDSGWIYTLWLNTDLTFTLEATPTPDPQPTPDPKPTPQPEVKPETKPEVKPETKPAAKSATTTATTKTVEKTTQAKKSDAVLATTGDTTAMTVAALGIAGATVAAAGLAATKRRKR
ncbi:LPXTG cell wall anchor domain-containing protein [Collinsella aerofaciens]|uniref:LPXTG cell wall anchor domain-containing protein n=1 Tax=Collinsella TaxID=102106 RepID=UPI001C037E8A|nr:LPXTG cell wall anchor domain-containing protein [Collinsella aerofaciens]MBT9761642.1 LPXTG cell wall anchor domain-containing protein [Collinsella aerofaciens]